MLEKEYIQNHFLQQIYDHIQDGIIIMTTDRQVLMINPAARRLTGWGPGDHVPFCSYCMQRKKKPGENQCYLIEHNEIPYFLSEMPTYDGSEIEVEMSTALMYTDSASDEKGFLLVLRDRTQRKQLEEAAMSKKMIRALIEAQESEHKRLARELHDGVGQSLYSVSVALQAIESYVDTNEMLSEYITEVRNELQRVMDDVKDYSHRLRPHSLDQLGLEPTLRTLVESINKNQDDLEVTLYTESFDRFDPSVEINLYRVVQEAIHNVLKYANATKVEISLMKNDTHTFLKIKDNGIGFRRKEIKSEGLGLKHMEERIEQLGGTLKIKSEIGEGTLIDIVIPRWRPKNDKSNGSR